MFLIKAKATWHTQLIKKRADDGGFVLKDLAHGKCHNERSKHFLRPQNTETQQL